MTLAQIDLTLESMFAGEDNPSLKFETARQYDRKHSVEGGDVRILDKTKAYWIGGVHVANIIPITSDSRLSNNDFFPYRENVIDTDFVCTMIGIILDHVPKWYRKSANNWDWIWTSGTGCFRCGTKTNLLNSDCGLCDSCNKESESNGWKWN